MDRDVLMHQMTERFQALYSRALDALERAPDGQCIPKGELTRRDPLPVGRPLQRVQRP